MPRITIDRSGLPPLAFDGDKLAEATSRRSQVEDASALAIRWHEIALYRTAAGRVIPVVRYVSAWKDEPGFTEACSTCPNQSAAVEWLTEYDPREHVHGYPPGEGFRARQARLLQEIETGYDLAVSSLLSQLNDVAEFVA